MKLNYFLILTFSLLPISNIYSQILDSLVVYKPNYLDELERSSKRIFNNDETENIEIYQVYDNKWINRDKDYEKINTDNKLAIKSQFKWNENSWEKINETKYSYTDTSKLTEGYTFSNAEKTGLIKMSEYFFEDSTIFNTFYYKWEYGSWLPDKLIVLFYDYGNILIERQEWIWDWDLMDWKRSYLYETILYTDLEIYQKNEYRYSDDHWWKWIQKDYYYDGNLLTKIIKLNRWSESEEFKPSEKNEYSDHDAKRRPKTDEHYLWNIDSEKWYLSAVIKKEYDQWDNEILYESRKWNNQYNYFEYGYKDEKEYNETGKRTYFARYDWSPYISDWILDTKYYSENYGDSIISYSYLNGSPNSKSVSYINNGLTDYRINYTYSYKWELSSITYFYYSGVVNTEVIEKQKFVLYPNPTNGVLFFSDKCRKFKIYDIYGRLIKQGENKKQTNLSNFPNGSYIINIDNESQKIIKY